MALKEHGLLWALSACSGYFQERVFLSLSGQPVLGFDHLCYELSYSFYLI